MFGERTELSIGKCWFGCRSWLAGPNCWLVLLLIFVKEGNIYLACFIPISNTVVLFFIHVHVVVFLRHFCFSYPAWTVSLQVEEVAFHCQFEMHKRGNMWLLFWLPLKESDSVVSSESPTEPVTSPPRISQARLHRCNATQRSRGAPSGMANHSYLSSERTLSDLSRVQREIVFRFEAAPWFLVSLCMLGLSQASVCRTGSDSFRYTSNEPDCVSLTGSGWCE